MVGWFRRSVGNDLPPDRDLDATCSLHKAFSIFSFSFHQPSAQQQQPAATLAQEMQKRKSLPATEKLIHFRTSWGCGACAGARRRISRMEQVGQAARTALHRIAPHCTAWFVCVLPLHCCTPTAKAVGRAVRIWAGLGWAGLTTRLNGQG